MPTAISQPDLDPLVAALVVWFRQEARDYPWRRTRDPYAILIAEIMLQQTQIATVLERGYYVRWLERFPDFHTLAAAREEEVLKAWEGLGYYRRARNLHRLAREVIEKHGGRLPRDKAALLALPGVGAYTAGAVASFAFELAEPIVDGNIARVLSRLYDDATPVDSTAGSKRLWARATALVQQSKDPFALNSALMELGQTLCTPTKPACDLCPVSTHCRATDPLALPVKQARPAITAVTERVFFRRTPQGVLLERETGRRRTGLWKLPELDPAATTSAVLLRSDYSITRYKVTLWVHAPPASRTVLLENQRIIPFAELESTPMPAPYRRALQALLGSGDFELHA